MKERGDGIRTYTGIIYFPLSPSIEEVEIEDIAHALAMQCRFAGHTKFHYSVAQHSVLVSALVEAYHPFGFGNLTRSELALWGLMHDASEAYLVDLPRPLKHSGKFDYYKEVEMANSLVIAERFELPLYGFETAVEALEPKPVKTADVTLLYTEQRDLFNVERDEEWHRTHKPLPTRITPWSPESAKETFLTRFYYLQSQVFADRYAIPI